MSIFGVETNPSSEYGHYVWKSLALLATGVETRWAVLERFATLGK